MFGSWSRYPSIKKISLSILLFGGLLFAQEQKGENALPLLAKPTPNYGLLAPEEKDEDYSFLNSPKENNRSMTDNETFIDPGKKYLNKLNREGSVSKDTYLGDVFLGDVFTLSKRAQILLRDFGTEDGDYVRVLVNDEEIIPRLMLRNQFFTLDLRLQEGFNKIEFQALNEGSLYPNTAEFRMYDDLGVPLATHLWNLSKGAKASIILVKEGDRIRKE
jgi:hypothetical protein